MARSITPATVNRLAALVVPHLMPGEPVLVYVLHQWRRIGHLVIEPQMLSTLYGDTYRRIVVVTGSLARPGSNPAVPGCFGPEIVFVQTDFSDVLSLGNIDGGLRDFRHFHWLAMSPRSLIVACFKAMVAGRRPVLLQLPEALREHAHRRLRERGFDPAARFVLFHHRTMKYLPSEVHHGHRTAAIGPYEPSLRRILAAGYQILRIGEPGLETWPRAPDGYLSLPDAFPDDRTLDIFACADCAFATAQNSGPIWVVAAFGRTTLRTNTPFEHLNLPYNDDLSMFKRYRRHGERRFLSYREILAARLPGMLSDAAFRAAGVELVENSAEEIDAATAEMLGKIEGGWAPDLPRHERFRALGQAYEREIACDPRFIAEDLAFYGYAHPFGWISRATLDDDALLA